MKRLFWLFLLNVFANHLDDKTKNYLDDLDFGYLAAESSAGEEGV